jgi:hypothetical protein
VRSVGKSQPAVKLSRANGIVKRTESERSVLLTINGCKIKWINDRAAEIGGNQGLYIVMIY